VWVSGSKRFGASTGAQRARFPAGEFVRGVNLPWITYGGDFGANAWRPQGGVNQPDRRAEVEAAFARLSAAGIRTVRWWLLCDGRAGIRFSPTGRPDGLDDYVFRDIDAALALAGHHRVRVIFVLLDFIMCRRRRDVNGVAIGGRRQLLRRGSHREALFAHVLQPILKRYRSDPAIFAWDIFNEPEWVTLGLGSKNPAAAIRRHDMAEFLGEACDVVHRETVHPVTVGSAGTRWRHFYRALPLDFHEVHWYESLRSNPAPDVPLSELGFVKPVVLGEFPESNQALADTARKAGYAGAFFWPGV